MGPVDLFEAATTLTSKRLEGVSVGQLSDPTPCSEWDVRALVEHVQGGPAYLSAALGERVDPAAVAVPGTGWSPSTYAGLRERCLTALRPAVTVHPGVLPQDRLLGATGRRP